jgi:hypothetical protein
MIPTAPTDHNQPIHADDSRPRFFLDDAYDANTDGDWWLDLGAVDLPTAPAV